MDIVPITIKYYQMSSGHSPYREWLDSLDIGIQVIIDARLIRVRRGLFGNTEHLGSGVWELKFDVGPGYRVYYGRDAKTLVILLHAGHKKSQSKDIETAHEFWADYLRRSRK